MGWNRSASLLTLVVFLAFGFQVVGVFSEPITRNQPSIATVGDYRYGVLGWCPKNSDDNCSSYGVGYTLQDNTDTKWSGSTQRTLSSIMIVHIVAAGLLLITFIGSCGTHWRNQRYWTGVEVMLSLSFTASALSFAVEVALFRTYLNFAGWFTLGSTVLCIVAIVALALMQKSLQASLGRTNIGGKNPLLTADSVMFERGGDFVVGRDDEKMLQGSSKIQKQSTSLTGFQAPKPPALKGSGSDSKYERIPDGNSTTGSISQRSQQSGISAGSRTGTLPNARLPQLPMGSTESVGAIPRQQQGNWQRTPIPQTRTGMSGGNPANMASVAGAGAGAAGTGASGVAGSAGAASGLVAGVATGAGAGASSGQNRSQNQQGQSRAAHVSTVSIASTQAARVPAGAYLHDFADAGKYGSNVVQMPKARAGELKAESATIEYYKDETESKSPLAQDKVPNFSRMSAQEREAASPNSRAKGTNHIMLDRYMDSAHLAASPHQRDPYYEAAVARAGAQTPESESSHYTSISERPQQRQEPTAAKQPPSQNAAQIGQETYAYQNAQTQHADPYAQYYGGSQGYQGNEGMYSSYYQQPQTGYQYYPNQQPQYYGQPAQYGQQVAYGTPNNGYQGYSAYQPSARPQPRPQAQTTQRSELALQSNPDFSLGNLGKKKRPGMR